MAMRRSFPTVLSDRLPETRDFYVALLGFRVAFDSDWYVALTRTDGPDEDVHELAIWAVGHELVPPPYRADPAGVILTFMVDDVDAVHAEARRLRLPLVAPPRDLFHGRRQMLVTDPNGMLVEISSPSTPSPAFTAELARRGRAAESLG
ncbi:catechol 2,3-dioxygenase-like lactoylglutathione lyase family enzyme [Actinomycetospora succinea]|uniref:Catechol 2,3-dioxygenase-like lactoylglutathione lyase family enzyme n=1 Tax=Actinomycetospora succinea TaxID=663603 RepID=A0A4R6VHM4_9PSEU|nr:VOC family protein [Actinomycetospora succinea]TDQ62828.1 catechol 2,3-dioxygenase-like lactoylglutathione lyase family enzyme [Actinomycetospora succinea]